MNETPFAPKTETPTGQNPWDFEPSTFDGEAHGLKYALRRGPSGAWCGYVAIPKAHPLFGKAYNDYVNAPPDLMKRKFRGSPFELLLFDNERFEKHGEVEVVVALDVHGGITYSSNHSAPDEPDGNWWFGFDCSHAGDLSPRFDRYISDPENVYRTFDYAKAECEGLARQLSGWNSEPSPSVPTASDSSNASS